jgi:hypothetical protein
MLLGTHVARPSPFGNIMLVCQLDWTSTHVGLLWNRANLSISSFPGEDVIFGESRRWSSLFTACFHRMVDTIMEKGMDHLILCVRECTSFQCVWVEPIIEGGSCEHAMLCHDLLPKVILWSIQPPFFGGATRRQSCHGDHGQTQVYCIPKQQSPWSFARMDMGPGSWNHDSKTSENDLA